MSFACKRISVLVGLACLAMGSAHGAPTSGAYVTDPQNEWVHDQMAERIGMPNMIMCFMSNLRADAMVNQGNYVALVDMEACQSRGQDSSSSTNAGASASTNYTRVVVNSSRASNNDPMIVNTWFKPEDSAGERIFARATVYESPTSSNPNGRFSVSFCGVPSSRTDTLSGGCDTFLGSMSASGTALTFAESGNFGSPYTTQLTISQSGTTSGSGRIKTTEGGNFDLAFAYDANYFKRGTASLNRCFSRDRSLAKFSTWRYGVYASNGSRLELANPAFNIKADYNGQTYWGQASFWGIFLPGNVLANVSTVSRVTPGSEVTTDYALTKAGGKLYKMTKASGALGNLKGQTIQIWLPGNVVAGDTQGGQYDLSWNGTGLKAIRKQTGCDQNGCGATDLATQNLSVTAASLRTNAPWMKALQGWSQSAGGELRIEVPASGEFDDNTAIASRTRQLVAPGSAGAPTGLACVNRCPKGGLTANDFTSSPYQNITFNAWGGGTQTANSEFSFQPVTVGNAIAYSFPSSGLLTTGGSQTVDASGLTLSGNHQWGLQSGRLLDTASASYTAARCDSTAGYSQSNTGDSLCPWLVENADVFYTYETGPNAWNQYVGLSNGGSTATFDPPRIFPLTLSTTNTDLPADGQLIGSTVQLQFGGFGELQGIPGRCVNTTTNVPETCTGSNNQRWVPAFTIKDGAELTDNSGTYYVKYLEREMRFAKVDDSQCSALTLPTTATLPDLPSTANDPRGSSGAEPAVTAAPKVIQGVVQ